MKKISILVLLVLLLGVLAGCAPAAEEPVSDEPASEESLRVAMIFNTTIKDGGYAQAGYEALMDLKDKYNFPTRKL